MAVAIILGILVGAVSILPLGFSARRIRKVNPTQSMNLLGWFLLTIIISFVILIAGLIICRVVAEDLALVFAIAEFAAFIVGLVVFGIVFARRR